MLYACSAGSTFTEFPCYSASSGQLSFRLTVYPSPQFLQIDGRLYHPFPASPRGRKNQTQHGPFVPETLLSFIAITGHSAILLPFGPFPVSTVIGPTFFREFLLGAYRTSPVSVVSLLPCRRHYPAGVNYLFSQSEIAHAVFADIEAARPPETNPSLTRLAQRSLALQPGNSLASLKLTLSVGFSMSIALHAATHARRLLAFTAAGLPPRK